MCGMTLWGDNEPLDDRDSVIKTYLEHQLTKVRVAMINPHCQLDQILGLSRKRNSGCIDGVFHRWLSKDGITINVG